MLGKLDRFSRYSGREEARENRASRALLRGASSMKGEGVVYKDLEHLEVTPDGTLTGGQVSRVINARAKSIAHCYNDTLAQNPTAQGRIDLQWVVERNGLVGKIKILYDGVGAPGLVQCLRSVIKTWRFPEPSDGPAVVGFPFRFSNPKL